MQRKFSILIRGNRYLVEVDEGRAPGPVQYNILEDGSLLFIVEHAIDGSGNERWQIVLRKGVVDRSFIQEAGEQIDSHMM